MFSGRVGGGTAGRHSAASDRGRLLMYGDQRYIDAIYSAELKSHGTDPVLLVRRLTELYSNGRGGFS
jgi:hypothetical protein